MSKIKRLLLLGAMMLIPMTMGQLSAASVGIDSGLPPNYYYSPGYSSGYYHYPYQPYYYHNYYYPYHHHHYYYYYYPW